MTEFDYTALAKQNYEDARQEVWVALNVTLPSWYQLSKKEKYNLVQHLKYKEIN